MAGRRALMQLLRVSQVHTKAGDLRPVVAVVQSAAVPRQAGLASFAHGEVGRQGFERNLYGGSSFSTRHLHNETQAKVDNHETHEYENAKMTSEGGGSVGPSFSEKKEEIKNSKTVTKASDKVDEVQDKASDKVDEVKDKASDAVDDAKDKASDVKDKASETVDKAKENISEAEDKAGSVTGSVAEKASKEADTAKDMFKDFPQKVSETATGLKEVGVEAAKAVKRDAEKVAGKVGLKSD